jgi:hypothetical protein
VKTVSLKAFVEAFGRKYSEVLGIRLSGLGTGLRENRSCTLRLPCSGWAISAGRENATFVSWVVGSAHHVEFLMLGWEPLLLSTQSVIFLSLKTMLNNVGSALFLLNSATFLSVKSFALDVAGEGLSGFL